MLYRALQTVALHYPGGGMLTVRAGELIDDEKIVAAFPDVFEAERPIERSTARPGEKSTARRVQ